MGATRRPAIHGLLPASAIRLIRQRCAWCGPTARPRSFRNLASIDGLFSNKAKGAVDDHEAASSRSGGQHRASDGDPVFLLVTISTATGVGVSIGRQSAGRTRPAKRDVARRLAHGTVGTPADADTLRVAEHDGSKSGIVA